MKLKSYLLLGMAALGLMACDKDFGDWKQQATNDQPAIISFGNGSVAEVEVINFADIAEGQDSVQVCKITAPTSSYAETANIYEITFSAKGEELNLKLDSEGRVLYNDFKQFVEKVFGLNPNYIREISAVVTAYTGDGKTAVKNVLASSATFSVKAKTAAPFIDPDGYYYIGALGTDKTYKLTNGGGDVYDDPVFTGIIPAYEGDRHWFKVAPACAFKDDGSFDWDKEEKFCVGPTIKDDDATSGSCSIGKNSWHLIQSDAYVGYRITVNVMDLTFKIEGISAIPEYYGVGTMTKWNNLEKVSAMFPTSGNTVTLTTYFTGAWDMRMWPAENFGDGAAGKAIGITENGGNAESGKLVWNTENDGNLASPEAGYYTLECDFKTMTYQWTKYSDQAPATYEKIGLVGANDDWNNDIFLTQVTNTTGETKPTHLWYALGVNIEYCSWGVQFRADGAWNKQWGKGDQGFPFAQSNTTSNIEGVEPGTYNIYFNDITGHYFFVAQ